MKIELTKKENDIINFLQNLTSEKNKKIIAEFLIKKGIESLSKSIINLPKNQKEFLSMFIKK